MNLCLPNVNIHLIKSLSKSVKKHETFLQNLKTLPLMTFEVIQRLHNVIWSNFKLCWHLLKFDKKS